MRLAPHDVVLVVGKRGSGKSYRAKKLLGEEMAAGARVCAFDVHDEYSQLGRRSRQTNLGPLTQRCTVEELLDSGGRLLDNEHLAMSIVPRRRPKQAIAEDFADVLALVNITGRLTFAANEVGLYSRLAEEDLDEAATQSRHVEVPIVFIAQRMVQVPLTARSQTSWLITGVQNAPADIKALYELTGSDTFAQEVSRLPRRQQLEWRDSTN